ncbi:MAG TPA: hypothetical protein VHK01_12225 [Lacipirellulaceae bacterium]|nr:hypothetical protein [Lacipirellulaceae bacterium]
MHHPPIKLLKWAPLVALALGCQRAPELETWPVQGTVVDQSGARLTSGAVRFFANAEKHAADPHLITVGPINSDGSFSVRTHRQGFTYDGAVAGVYRVLVMTDKTTSDGQKVPVEFELPETRTVERRENKLDMTIRR